MPRLEQTVSAGTKSVAPVTIGKLPVYVAGIPTPTVSDSIFAQSADGHSVIVGVGAAVNAGQVANAPAVVIGEGASAWGNGAVAIGKGASAGVNAARDGCISIGSLAADGKNGIAIGSALAFGGVFDDFIRIGTQAVAIRSGAIAIGMAASAAGTDGIGIGHSSSGAEGSSIAIGRGAVCSNSGLGVPNTNIAIGDGAVCSPTFSGGVIAIGTSATSNAQKSLAIGGGANVTGVNVVASIAIGWGATSTLSNEVVFGNPLNGNHVAIFTVSSLAANPVRHRVGSSGGWAIRDAGNANDIFLVDSSATAGDIRLLLWDVTAGVLKRVTMAAAGAAPDAGHRALQVVV